MSTGTWSETPPSHPAGRYDAPVSNPSGVEARLAALEARMEEVAADAAAARHLASAGDRDLADLAVRRAISALGVHTAGRFDGLEHKVDTGFAEMRGRLDQTAAGQQQIVDLLTTLIDRDE